MLFRQVTHDDLGCASCLIGDHDAGVAASLLSRLGLKRLVHVADGGVGTWERQGHPIER